MKNEKVNKVKRILHCPRCKCSGGTFVKAAGTYIHKDCLDAKKAKNFISYDS